MFDQSARFTAAAGADASTSAAVPEIFFRTTFELMGHVAKSDGRVSEAEIDAARRLMHELRLGPHDVSIAIECLAGNSPTYDAGLRVEQLREACGLRHDLLRAFMELQLRAALAGNGISPSARRVLTRVAGELGMSGFEFAHMESAVRARQTISSRGSSSAAASAATVKKAGVAVRPVSILRSVSAGTPDTAAISAMLRGPRASRSGRPSRSPRACSR